MSDTHWRITQKKIDHLIRHNPSVVFSFLMVLLIIAVGQSVASLMAAFHHFNPKKFDKVQDPVAGTIGDLAITCSKSFLEIHQISFLYHYN